MIAFKQVKIWKNCAKILEVFLIVFVLFNIQVVGQKTIIVTDIQQNWSILKVPQPFNTNPAASGEEWITNPTTGLLNNDWSWDVQVANIAPSQVSIINQMGNNAKPIWIVENVCNYSDDLTKSVAYFLRNTFEVSKNCEQVSSAIFRFTADNLSRVYINGEQIVSNNGRYTYGGGSVTCNEVCGLPSNTTVNIPPANDMNSQLFSRIEIADIKPYLKPGVNVIAVEAINGGGCGINYGWFCGNLEISFVEQPMTATLEQLVDSQCEEGGEVTVSVSGGTAPYTFQLGSGTPQQSGHFTSISPGDHLITITDETGCTGTITFTIENHGKVPNLSIAASDLVMGCNDTTTNIHIASSNEEGVVFSLDGGPFTSNNYFDNLAEGQHNIIAQDAYGCISLPITFEILNYGDFVFKSMNATICFGETYSFNEQLLDQSGTYFDTISVNVGCDSLNSLVLEVLDKKESIQWYEICQGDSVLVGSTYYSKAGEFVTVTESISGCDSFLLIQVDYLPPLFCREAFCNYFIPNAFTPNNDGINDYFNVETYDVTVNYMAIYNRWGDVVYTSMQEHPLWNGYFKNHPAENGVYVYIIKGFCNISNRPIFEYGNVTLIK